MAGTSDGVSLNVRRFSIRLILVAMRRHPFLLGLFLAGFLALGAVNLSAAPPQSPNGPLVPKGQTNKRIQSLGVFELWLKGANYWLHNTGAVTAPANWRDGAGHTTTTVVSGTGWTNIGLHQAPVELFFYHRK